jgi:prepilin-type N-terminal cleavage/methylation domain-containing protein/prepilin-type processing-associated H-X9-DG protein
MRRTRAFTLVELLVVIGIIAVLISILLPTLGAVRKQAAATKCATALREIGNAMQMYAMENKGYMPAPQVIPRSGHFYNVDGVDYPRSGVGAYWFTFIAKYVTKTKVGTASDQHHEAADARKTVIWGCPEWEGYRTGTIGEMHRAQVGLGMNHYPTFTESYPAPGVWPPRRESTFIQNWTRGNPSAQDGNWAKLTRYGRRGAQRALVMDSQFWLAEAQAPPGGVIPGQRVFDTSYTYSPGVVGQTLTDFYRHGKPPKLKRAGPGGYYDTFGGKVAFNILYCDGHVTTEHDRRVAYRALRMKFPG